MHATSRATPAIALRYVRITALALLLAGAPALAQEGAIVVPPAQPPDEAEPTQSIEMAPDSPASSVKLRVVGDRVNVRVRADINSMIAMQVERDMILEAVGREFDWFRIKPPPGAFSMVSAEYIQRTGEDRGAVNITSGTLRVRAGSELYDTDPITHEVQARLENAAPVRILGEQNGWLRIVPPEGVYLYISSDLVQPVDADALAVLPTVGPAPAPPVVRQHLSPEDDRPLEPAEQPATRPADALRPVATLPATPAQPPGTWVQRLVELERRIAAEQNKPVLEQTWGPILAQLRPISDQQDDAPTAEAAREWVDHVRERLVQQEAERIAAERDARNQYAEQIRQAREEAERGRFDVEGQFKPTFAVPAGDYGLRYKILNPATGAVRAYVEIPWQTGISGSAHVGRYVGVRGEPVVGVELGAPLYRVWHMTILNPARPARPPRERP